MIFFRTPSLLPVVYPKLVWRIPTKKKIIYLTFDDGPVPGPTEFVLNTLKTFRARSTFFCIGENIDKHPAIFAQLIAEGHQVGNHTNNHLNGWKTDGPRYIENVKECQDKLPPKTPHLFRPPYGRITRRQIRLLSTYEIVMWDVLSHDYNPHITPDRCLSNSIRATRPGAIVVFHDSLKAERNMMFTLPRYLEHFASEGFSFTVLPTKHDRK